MKKWFKGKKQAGNELDAEDDDQSAMPKRAREEGGEEVQLELAETKAAIKKVEKEIGVVEGEIGVVGEQLKGGDAFDAAWGEVSDRRKNFGYTEEAFYADLQEEKKALRDKEKQLRDKEKLLLERLARLEGGGAKRAKFLQRGNPTGVGAMFAGLHDVKAEDGVLKFAHKVLAGRGDIIWKRPCYSSLYDEMWKLAVRGQEYYPVIMTGTSGIGKSFFGIYALWRAVVERGITVIYTQAGRSEHPVRYVIAPPAAAMQEYGEDDARRLLLKLRGDYPGVVGEDPVEGEDDCTWKTKSMWWGELNQAAPGADKFIARLKEGKSTWVFWDMQGGLLTESSQRAVVLVSDVEAVYRKYLKENDGARLYVPAWTLGELKEARPSIMAELDEAALSERFDKVGGVARSIFASSWDDVVSALDGALNRLGSDTMSNLLNPEASADVTTQLVHHVSGPPYKTSRQVFASQYVRDKVFDKLMEDGRFKTGLMVKYSKGLIGGSERGAKFEWFAHVTLAGMMNNSLSVCVAPLEECGVGAPARVQLKPFATKVFLFQSLDDMEEIVFSTYYQPSSDNYPAIDSFCLVHGCPWDSRGQTGSQEPTLLLFQMTVAQDKHDTLGEPLKKIIGRVNDLTDFDQNTHNIFLIFITDSDNISKAEPYLTSGRPRTQLQENNLGVLKYIRQLRIRVDEEQKLKHS